MSRASSSGDLVGSVPRKVTASFDRTESYVRVIDGQVRCITGAVHVNRDFGKDHGSGNVERQWSNSDVSSGAITGSSLSFGLYWVVSAVALPLLRCACTFAASYTA